jgi:hypothetical protein
LFTTTNAVNYTATQVQAVLGIGQETLRYWRKTLPPLARDHGKYTFPDLIALRVVLHLTRAGFAIGSICRFSEELFKACRMGAIEASSSEAVLVIQPGSGAVFRLDHGAAPKTEFAILLPISPLVAELLECLGGPSSTPQLSLALPLTAVGG